MPHFTYDDSFDKEALQQGDVLERTSDLEAILQEVHPHYYSSSSYKHFIVLTQTCDLVPRYGGERKCKSRYITIAAVRPLKLVVEREIDRLMQLRNYDYQLGVTDDKTRSSLKNFVERLLNNNEDDFFYLEADPSRNLPDDSCAFLHLSIALKSDLHYDTLLRSKVLQLRVDFQHKLGYQVGKSYSRVATEDWVPGTLTDVDFQKKIGRIIKSCWKTRVLDPKLYKRIIEKASGEMDLSDPSSILEKFIDEIRREKEESRDSIMTEIRKSLEETGIDKGLARKAVVGLASNPHFKTLLKKALE